MVHKINCLEIFHSRFVFLINIKSWMTIERTVVKPLEILNAMSRIINFADFDIDSFSVFPYYLPFHILDGKGFNATF